MANSKIIYPSGDASPITYTFPKNPADLSWGYLETDDNARAFDGTLNSFAGARKKFYELRFVNVLKTQADYFMTLYSYQCSMDLYIDGVNLDATVKMISPPSPKAEAFWNGADRLYSFDVRFEEV